MMKRIVAVLAAIGLLSGLGACAGDEPSVQDMGKVDDGDGDGKEDAWDYRNDPDRFRQQFNYHLSELPRSGEATQSPWPGWYWPYYRDSANYRWQGRDNLSPAELYDIAKDPGEQNNLAAEHPEKIKTLYKKLFKWELELERPLFQLRRAEEAWAAERFDEFRKPPLKSF